MDSENLLFAVLYLSIDSSNFSFHPRHLLLQLAQSVPQGRRFLRQLSQLVTLCRPPISAVGYTHLARPMLKLHIGIAIEQPLSVAQTVL